MFLGLIFLLNLSFGSLVSANELCDDILIPNVVRIEPHHLVSTLHQNTKAAADFLVTHQNQWTPEEKVARFLSFIKVQGLTSFDMQRVLTIIPHKLLNLEFRMNTQARMSLGYSGNFLTGSYSPGKIVFRHRLWRSVDDLAQDVLLWNLMVSKIILETENRTAMTHANFVNEYKADSKRIFAGIADLYQQLFKEKLLDGRGLEIDRELNKIKLQSQNGQESCTIRNRGNCVLWSAWAWQNLMRFTTAMGIATASLSTSSALLNLDVNMVNKASNVIPSVVSDDWEPALKLMGLSTAKRASNDDRCEIANERIEEMGEKVLKLSNKPNKTSQELKDLEVTKSSMSGLKAVYSWCQ